MADIIESIFTFVEGFYNVIFVLLPVTMRAIAFSLLLATISKCFKKKKGWKWGLAKVALFAFYAGWGYWKITQMGILSLPEQIMTLVMIAFVAVAIILIYWVREFSFFGYQIINYYTIWVFFFIALAVILFVDYQPGAIGFSIFYCAVSIVMIRLSKNEVKGL